MISINPNWRVLTIGDGDLSFSASLNAHHQISHITASIFYDIASLDKKYGPHHYQHVLAAGCQVLSQFDVSNANSWQGLNKNSFDFVIFQFPLIPNDGNKEQREHNQQFGGENSRNRMLLRQFLRHSFRYFLAEYGARLCMISSKDVKPYRQWNIEQALTYQLDISYLGQQPFLFEQFPDYKLRNVDRDKFVKETQAISYFWSDIDNQLMFDQLQRADYLTTDSHDDNITYCAMCRVGPMKTDIDRQAHYGSKRHLQMQQFEQQWLKLLNLKR